MNDTIGDALDGNWLNFILPLGWVALLLFAVSLFFLTIYLQWAGVRTFLKILTYVLIFLITHLLVISFLLVQKSAKKFLQESDVESGEATG